MSKSKNNRVGIVYSTRSDFEYEEDKAPEKETLENHQQLLYVSIDRKNRKGKNVTLIEGFIGQNEDLKTLAKHLKTICGVGGTIKNNEILIQGDFRDKIIEYLNKENYKTKRKGG